MRFGYRNPNYMTYRRNPAEGTRRWINMYRNDIRFLNTARTNYSRYPTTLQRAFRARRARREAQDIAAMQQAYRQRRMRTMRYQRVKRWAASGRFNRYL